MFIFEFSREFIGVRVDVILVVDPDNLNNCGYNPEYFPAVGFRLLIFKLITKNTEVDNITQVIISFFPKPDLVF